MGIPITVWDQLSESERWVLVWDVYHEDDEEALKEWLFEIGFAHKLDEDELALYSRDESNNQPKGDRYDEDNWESNT